MGAVELGHQPLAHGLEQVVPAGEVEEEGALGDAGLTDHVLDPHPRAVGG
jgi:hypothetical protein